MPVRSLFIGILLTLAAAVGVSIWGWFRIPDQAQVVALHWNRAGEADRFVSKAHALLALPLLMLAVSIVAGVVRKSVYRAGSAYVATTISGLALVAVVHGAVVFNAVNGEIPIARLLIFGVAALYVVLGVYLSPRMLNDERSRARTHGTAGRLFGGLGAILLVAAFTVPSGALLPLLAICRPGRRRGAHLLVVDPAFLTPCQRR